MKHFQKGVFIQDLKSNAIFAAAEMFCPLKLSDVPHFTDAGGGGGGGGGMGPLKNPEGKHWYRRVGKGNHPMFTPIPQGRVPHPMFTPTPPPPHFIY